MRILLHDQYIFSVAKLKLRLGARTITKRSTLKTLPHFLTLKF